MNNVTSIRAARAVLAAALVCGVAACSAPTESESEDGAQAAEEVNLDNCGAPVESPSPAQRMLVTDASIAAITLAVDGADNIGGVTTVSDKDLLTTAYGEDAAGLNYITEDVATLETVLGADPDVVFSGWGYGLSDSSGITPDALAEREIATYLLSDSCRGEADEILAADPWDSLRTDLGNVAQIVGHPEAGDEAIADLDGRLDALTAAEHLRETPQVLVFDSAADGVFAPGGVGAPNAIVEAAGAENVLADVDERWTNASWETLAANPADAIVFVDYPMYTLADKIAQLRENPATRDIPAVREGRFINIPYAMWTSGPLNIDAAEIVRKGLEAYDLVPTSDIEPGLAVGDLGVDGNEWA